MRGLPRLERRETWGTLTLSIQGRVGHFRIKSGGGECPPYTVKGPILTSKSTTLGWGTLQFSLLFD
jgi:hypothetical protein